MTPERDRGDDDRSELYVDDGPSGTTDGGPLVSAIVTTYDRPSYLVRAVESVHAQTYGPLELVVVDDHSETPAEGVLEGMDVDFGRFHGVHCVRHAENRGANAARNTGVRAATGEYVAFLDDDDRWHPEKVARQVRAFDAGGERDTDGDDGGERDVGVVYTGAVTERDGERESLTPAPVEGDLTRALLCRNVVGTLSAVMARRELATSVPLDESFPTWADLEWYVRLSTRTAFRRVPEPLVVYEFDSHGRLSADVEKELAAYERFLDTFDELAAEYGPLFRRKMRAWAAYRVGSTALNAGRYPIARRFLGAALARYPLESRFLPYFLATLGGRYSHDLARTVRDVAHRG